MRCTCPGRLAGDGAGGQGPPVAGTLPPPGGYIIAAFDSDSPDARPGGPGASRRRARQGPARARGMRPSHTPLRLSTRADAGRPTLRPALARPAARPGVHRDRQCPLPVASLSGSGYCRGRARRTRSAAAVSRSTLCSALSHWHGE